MANDFWVFKLDHVSIDWEDELSSWMFELGASGVQENLDFQQTDIKYLPEVQKSDQKTLFVYFESCPDPVLGDLIKERYPELAIELRQQKSKDWLSEWKQSWKPFSLAEGYWVVPTWLEHEFQKDDCEKILIDPGMAFGTGTHATTQMASELICRITKKRDFQQAVDVGTGSGILSILLERQGVESITAYDNDQEAKRVFIENMTLNSCRNSHWQIDWDQTNRYDLLVANIIDGVLLDLKSRFPEVPAARGPYYLFWNFERKGKRLSQ